MKCVYKLNFSLIISGKHDGFRRYVRGRWKLYLHFHTRGSESGGQWSPANPQFSHQQKQVCFLTNTYLGLCHFFLVSIPGSPRRHHTCCTVSLFFCSFRGNSRGKFGGPLAVSTQKALQKGQRPRQGSWREERKRIVFPGGQINYFLPIWPPPLILDCLRPPCSTPWWDRDREFNR